MRGYTPILGLMLLLLIVVGIIGVESFTSTGTIVQLQSSHVPTARELEERECLGGLYGCVYRWIPLGF